MCYKETAAVVFFLGFMHCVALRRRTTACGTVRRYIRCERTFNVMVFDVDLTERSDWL